MKSLSSIRVSKDNKLAVQRFSEDLRYSVNLISEALSEFFDDLVEGELGEDLRKITLDLFEGWCVRHDIPPLRRLSEVIEGRIREILKSTNATRSRLLDELVESLSEALRANEQEVRRVINECITNVNSGWSINELCGLLQ